MEIITSLDNEKVKYWNKLKQKKYKDLEGLFLIEGEHLVFEALKTKCVKEVIIEPEKSFSVDIPKHYVTKEILAKLSMMESPSDIIAVCSKLEEKKYGNRLLLIDAIQDPGNLGTIIRSAVAFNIDTIVLGENTVDLYNEKTIRASEGMLFHINIIKRSLNELVEELKNLNYKILGTRVTSGKRVKEVTINNKYALIIGNEGLGVKEDLLNKCDELVYIPMKKECESLNVAIATAIILYELGNNDNE